MENLKRRTAKDLEKAHKYALDGFVKALLEVKDSLSMGLKSAMDKNATLEHTIEGLELTNKVFDSTLEKFGVETVDPIGETFNPELHEAVTMVPMPDKKSNTVLEVVQVGFTLNDRSSTSNGDCFSKKNAKLIPQKDTNRWLFNKCKVIDLKGFHQNPMLLTNF